MNLFEEAAQWEDSEAYALAIRDRFNASLYADPELWAHRQYTGPRGMGEDCFHWLWTLLVEQLPQMFRFLEIGVFKGQILSLIRLLAQRTKRMAVIYGVTMLNTFAGSRPPHPEGDYLAAIQAMHDHFNQPMPILIVGDSTCEGIHSRISVAGCFDIVFVDACHDLGYVLNDLLFYGGLVKIGGFLVVDDAANNLHQPAGFFQGIQDVTTAVQTVILTDPKWEHVITVVHDRVFRRLA